MAILLKVPQYVEMKFPLSFFRALTMPDIGEFVPELVCMGVDLIICGVLYKAYSTTNSILRDLSSSPQVPIDENIRSTIQNHATSIPSGDASSYTIPYAVVRGDVSPMGKTVCSSYSTDMVANIQSIGST